MRNELSLDDVLSDPLIAQLRQADGISAPDFARVLLTASESYRASKVRRLQKPHPDQFYRKVGAGELQRQPLNDLGGEKARQIVAGWNNAAAAAECRCCAM
jgi:hypothetical protein